MIFGIALGSNVGDRLHHLRVAMMELLRGPSGVELRKAAPLYETEPVDCADGAPRFFNTVVEVATNLEPLSLLHELRRIESLLGRSNAHEHHAPRTVDLDLLYADDLALQHPELTLPHPRTHQRRFVLQPLGDIRPDLVLPGQTRSVAELLAKLDSPEPPLRVVEREWIQFP